MENPKLKFIISPRLDLQHFLLLDRPIIGNRCWAFFKLPPDLRFVFAGCSRDRRRDIVWEYLQMCYRAQKRCFLDRIAEVERDWLAVEDEYYALVQNLFGGHPWPAGDYLAVGSVWQGFSYDAGSQLFYFPLIRGPHLQAREVIAHELVHMLFWDYVEEKYGLRKKIWRRRRNHFVWQVSEALLTILQQWEPYARLVEARDSGPYSECRRVYERMKQDWDREQNVQKLLDKWLGQKAKRIIL